jgi:methyl-accepting chemotaxis protein
MEVAEAENRRQAALAQKIAGTIGQAWQQAITSGEISEAALFAAEYQPLADTNPPQFLAPHSGLSDRLLPPLIEPPLRADSQIIFCCVTDRNGYVATHNQTVSQPQRPGDSAWNIANARNRRFFDDRSGILAARAPAPYLTQIYGRDLGNGRSQVLKEIDVPIPVNGKPWGALRLGIRL